MAARVDAPVARAAFLAGAALACLVAGLAIDHGTLQLVGAALFLAAYVLGVVAEAREEREEPLTSRALVLAGVIAFSCVALAAALLSAVIAIFAGAAAFRWMAICLPLAAIWLVLSGAVRRLAHRIARRRA